MRFLSYFIGLVLLFFWVTPTFASTSVNLFQITSDGAQQRDPQIYGNIIVYTSFVGDGDNWIDIWAYSLETNKSFPVIEKSGQQFVTGLYKNLVVYEDVDASTSDYNVRLYNAETKKDILVAGGSGAQTAGVTNGRYIVYIDGGACGSLKLYTIDSKTTTEIYPSTCTPVKISGNIIVFPASNPNGTDIKGYNIQTKQVFDIATEDEFQEDANIYGNNVVYLQRTTGARGDYNAIMLKNLETGNKKVIYESSIDALNNPSVSPGYVVWSQSSAPHIGGVMGANLETGEVFTVQPQGPQQNSTTTPAIWKNIAAMMSWRTGNGDIYAATLNKQSNQIVVGAALSEYAQPTEEKCTIKVPSQYSTIQAAINAAQNSDTVCVDEGTYNEDVLINKPIRLSGKGALKSIINGQDPNAQGTVSITVNNVTLEGFLINGVSTNLTHVAVAINGSDSGPVSDAIVRYNRVVAGNGGIALRTIRVQNSTMQNNILEGNNSPYVAAEGGLNGVNSLHINFINNTFIGTVSPNDRSDTGITLDAGVPDGLIQRNVFNTTGTMIALISPNETSKINENNFNSNTTIKISNGWPNTVNAENNWWGDLDPSDNVQGDVDFTPFATSPYKEY